MGVLFLFLAGTAVGGAAGSTVRLATRIRRQPNSRIARAVADASDGGQAGPIRQLGGKRFLKSSHCGCE